MIAPDKTVKLILVYPMTTGRNFDEVLRVIDSLQLTSKHKVATPANWQQGDDVIIAGSVSDDEAREIYPEGWESPRPYIRIVPQPDGAMARVGLVERRSRRGSVRPRSPASRDPARGRGSPLRPRCSEGEPRVLTAAGCS